MVRGVQTYLPEQIEHELADPSGSQARITQNWSNDNKGQQRSNRWCWCWFQEAALMGSGSFEVSPCLCFLSFILSSYWENPVNLLYCSITVSLRCQKVALLTKILENIYICFLYPLYNTRLGVFIVTVFIKPQPSAVENVSSVWVKGPTWDRICSQIYFHSHGQGLKQVSTCVWPHLWKH